MNGNRLIYAVIGALLLAAPASAQIAQPQEVAVILIATSDANPMFTSQEADEYTWTNPLVGDPVDDRYLVSARERYLAASYGIYDLVRDSNDDQQPDIYGPYEVSGLAADNCDYVTWSLAALDEAVAEEPDVADYDHKIFIMPWVDEEIQNGCTWTGLGNAFSYAWINFKSGGLIMHEMGHNIQLNHNNDSTDFQGIARVVGLNAPHMLQQEFLLDSNVEEISSNDTVTLLPLYVDPYDFPGTRVVKIVVPSGDPYYISFRDDSGIDQNLEEGDQFAGFIHRWDGVAEVEDPLRIKKDDLFTDPGRNFTIEVTDISEGAQDWEMDIEVTFLSTGVLAYREPN